METSLGLELKGSYTRSTTVMDYTTSKVLVSISPTAALQAQSRYRTNQ